MAGVASCTEQTMQSFTLDQHESREVASDSAITNWTELAVPANVVYTKADVYSQALNYVALHRSTMSNSTTGEIGDRV